LKLFPETLLIHAIGFLSGRLRRQACLLGSLVRLLSGLKRLIGRALRFRDAILAGTATEQQRTGDHECAGARLRNFSKHFSDSPFLMNEAGPTAKNSIA